MLGNHEIHIVVFRLGGEEYCIPVSQVQEIQGYNKEHPPRRMPNSPDFVEGIINLRGQIIPVLDLKKRFSIGKIEPTRETCFIVVELDQEKMGILVDAVLEVLRVPDDTFEPPPAKLSSSINTSYITGVGKLKSKDKDGKQEKDLANRLVVLLDMEKVLNDEEIGELRLVEEEVA